MTQRKEPYAGVYKQNDGNTFIVTYEGDQLYLKTSEIHKEKCHLRADGLFSVENTNALLNFQIGPDGMARNLTFILPDRQTVAVRDIPLFKEQSLFEKFRELFIALIVFFALVGLFFLLQSPIQKACDQGLHPYFCKIASIGSRYTSTSSSHYQSKEAQETYKQITEDTKEDCFEGDNEACLLMAKNLYKLGQTDESFEVLKRSCSQSKHGPSCIQLKEYYLAGGQIDEAMELLNDTCTPSTPDSCFDLAWNLERDKLHAKANKYFNRACEYGVAEACYHLGQFHLKFERVLSQGYLDKACKRYHRKSCVLLKKVDQYLLHKKKCQEDNSPQSCFLMASFEQDYGDREVAFSVYERSCELGYKLACNIVKTQKTKERLKKSDQRIDTL